MQKTDGSVSAGRQIKINWEGSFFVHHSLGMVNRELVTELLGNPAFDIRCIRYEPDQFTPSSCSRYFPITTLQSTPHDNADIHIRHRWPPDFTKPSSGKFVLFQPWEYGSLPVLWLNEMNTTTIDQVWVYTNYLKRCYERSGVCPGKIVVTPLGVDPAIFNPQAPPNSWMGQESENRYCFLYNGGVTSRKGTDILVNAYLNEFTSDEPVCLVIKDSDAYTKGMAIKIKELAARSNIARIIYTSESIAHEELPGLYTAADCYVHPYRAEGYGLPIAEAMACDLPVIVTGGGACLDFTGPDTVFFVKCSIETIKAKKVGSLETVDFPFWLIPDVYHLQTVMRYVYTNRQKAQARGKRAGSVIRRHHTWNQAAEIIGRHLHALVTQSTTHQPPAIDCEKERLIDNAVDLLKDGNYTEATNSFQNILLKYGENSLSYEGLAIAAFYRRDYDEACNLFASANRLSPTNIDIIINWYEAAKNVGNANMVGQAVAGALQNDATNDDIRAIAIELNII